MYFWFFGRHIYDQERKAILRERELQVEFDNSLRIRGGELAGRLETRLRKKRPADPTGGEKR